MNLALTYCWKEWRAQRGLLVAYTSMVFLCLGLVLYLAPRHYWFEEGFGVHALTWFVIAGVIGVVGFAVPGLVRGEFTGKDDQFVRRLPGALWPAFWGKLLFAVLAAMLLPLLGLLVGELFVTSLGHDWNGLFEWHWQSEEITWKLPWEFYVCVLAATTTPWIWAVGTWTPNARLALLTTCLLVLVIGLGVFAVLRQSPNIEKGVDWWPWLWTVPVGGFVVAACSWGFGRRGGGPLRSARIGLSATAIVLLPGAAWLGDRAWSYHHPDPGRLQQMYVQGMSANGRFLLATVSERRNWNAVNVRIDLESGAMQVIAGPRVAFRPSLVWSSPLTNARQDLWAYGGDDGLERVYDLARDERLEVAWREGSWDLVLPAGIEAQARREQRRTSALRAPGGVKVWIERDSICFEQADGCVDREPWPFDSRWAWPMGHAVRTTRTREVYDLGRREVIANVGLVVGPWHLKRTGKSWTMQRGDAEPVPVPGFDDDPSVIGLLDDHSVLARAKERLFRITPETGDVVDIALPANLPFDRVTAIAPLSQWGSLLQRDPEGYVWLECVRGNMSTFARVHAETLHVTTMLTHSLDDCIRLIDWDERGVLVYGEGSATIERHDLRTGAVERVFPK